MKMFCISPSRIPIPLILLILTAASPSGGAGDLVGEAAQAPKKQRNSFLPILTAIIGIISTGDIAFDRAMQTAVGSHVQVGSIMRISFHLPLAAVLMEAPSPLTTFTLCAYLLAATNPLVQSGRLAFQESGMRSPR